MLKLFIRILLRFLYRVEIRGVENFQNSGDRVLIVANHTSFLDAVLLVAFLPEKLSFAINTQIAKRWYVKLIKPFVNLYVMDPMNPYSLKSLIRYMQADNKVVIFPEGRITVTGSLMKIYNGPGLVADRSGSTVLPVRINGAQYTPFSRLRGRVKLRLFPKITINVLPHRRIDAPEDVRGRERRKYAGVELSNIMTEMMYETTEVDMTLFENILNARRIHGGRHVIIEDIERQPLTYKKLLTRSFILGDAMAIDTRRGENVGVMLPNMNVTVLTFLALQIHGRTPAMLNFSTGLQGMLSACEVAKIKTVYTSRRFVKLSRLESVVNELGKVVRIIYLEDLRDKIGLLKKLKGFINAEFPKISYRYKSGHAHFNDPAVVLFTSGSEGKPKGVVLSHKNIIANTNQLSTRIDFNSQDVILNALPMFHSFGLSAGTLLPLMGGMRVFFYPSPLHYRIVPEMAYERGATIMFGTNTFLSGYARFAHPYDFYSVRYVFAGAEKLHEDTRKVWNERFGVRIFEGYGATETSPVLATNTPMENKLGTVGRFLPGIDYQLEPVPGVEKGGRLIVHGPNIMLGYLLHDKPGVIQPPKAVSGVGWYDTGDIVEVDQEGYITIIGRAKRFAKIAGEMVSLTAVEEFITQVWPNKHHAVVSIPDKKKGEQLVLLTETESPQRSELLNHARQQGLAELMIPRKIDCIKKIPLLGTGKTDYPAVQSLINEKFL